MKRNPVSLGLLLPALLAGLILPVAVRAESPASEAKPASSGRVVNINAASAAQLALLPRVGMKVAERIVDYRKANGPFKRLEDLMEVKGIGEKQFGRLKSYLALSGPTTLAEKIRSTGARSRAQARAGNPAKSPAANSKEGT